MYSFIQGDIYFEEEWGIIIINLFKKELKDKRKSGVEKAMACAFLYLLCMSISIWIGVSNMHFPLDLAHYYEFYKFIGRSTLISK